jgi:hypothetical protein
MTRLLATLIACTALIAGCGSDDEESVEAATSGETAAEAAEMGGTGGEAAGGESEAAAANPHAALASPSGTRSSGPYSSTAVTAPSTSSHAIRGARRAATATVPSPGRPSTPRAVPAPAAASIATSSGPSRRDGRRQVTYKGQALYFYVDDPRGQVLCNDIVEFGGTWYAVDSKGNPPA